MYIVIFFIALAFLLDVSCCIISARKNKAQVLVSIDENKERSNL